MKRLEILSLLCAWSICRFVFHIFYYLSWPWARGCQYFKEGLLDVQGQ